MIYQLFSIYDNAVNKFNLPFAATTEREAIRNFLAAASDQNSLLFKAPQDFALYHIATFDDELAQYSTINPAVRIITGEQAKLANTSSPEA